MNTLECDIFKSDLHHYANMRAALLSNVERLVDNALEEMGGVVVFGSAFDNSHRYLKALVEYNKWECTEGTNYIAAKSRRNRIEILIDPEGKYTCLYKTIRGGETHTIAFDFHKLGNLEGWLRQQLD